MYDLHIHSHYSDGRYSPADIIAAASRLGLRAVAITDHDNLRGSRVAQPLALAAGIELIPAIELTTRWPGADLPLEDVNVDLLGYYFDPDHAEFNAFTEAALNDLHARISACCARLTTLGYPLELADVYVENPRYAGTIQLIDTLRRKGYAADWREAMRLMNAVWLRVRSTPFTIRSAIEQIHLAGGVAVLAHPTLVRPQGELLSAAWLRQLVDAGLDGIEIYHRRLTEADRAYFLRLARTLGLLVSGGSDMHGWHRGMDELGTQPVSAAMVAALRARSTFARSAG